MTRRVVVYGTVAVWTAGVVGVTIYALPPAQDDAIATIKTGLVVWGVGVGLLAAFFAWRYPDFFPEDD